MSFPTLTNVRLRVQVDTSGGDPPTGAMQLEWNRAAADAVWRAVGSVALGAMPAYSATGQAAAAVAASIITPITPAKPSTVNAGDLLILQVLARNDESDGAGPATITDWTAFAGNPYGGTNNSRQSLYWRIAGAGEASQTVSVTCTGNTSGTDDLAMARIYRFTAANGFAAVPIEDIEVNAGTASPMAAPASVTPTGLNRRAVCMGAIATSDAAIGSMTGESAGDWTEAVTGNTTTGGDGTLNVQTADASAGTAISGGSIAFTLSTSAHWNTVGFCLVPVSAPIVLSPSTTPSDIAAGGTTNTTGQLTLAGGKTFGGGKISDDTNPVQTVDLATNQVGEWEWCLQATATAVNGEVYQFRVTLAGTPLTTYSQTPTWTIGAAATPNIRDVASRLKLTVRAYRDAATRLKLNVRAYRDTSTRLKLTVRAYRDAATRLVLNARTYKDAATRLKLTVRAYRDAATRLKLTVRAYRDAATRLKLSGQATKDVTSRFRLAVAGPAIRDVASRVRLSVLAYRDIATRLKLGVLGTRDTATRVKLSVRTYRDTATRFRLNTAAVYRDVRSRMVLQGGPGQLLVTFTAPLLDENGQPLPGDLDGFLVYYGTAPGVYGPPIDIGHITTYLLTGLIHGTVYYVAIRSYDTFGNQSALSAESSKAADPLGMLYPHLGDVATRFRLAVTTPRDVFARFKLAARQWVHVATRVKLQIRGFRDTATRVKLTGRAYRDVSARLTLTGRAYKDVATRVRLAVASTGLRDVATRVKLTGLAYKDTATRVKLTLLGLRDIATRLKLTGRGFRDTATRLKLGVLAFRNVAARLTLGARAFADVPSRVKISVGQYTNVATRFRLAVANAGIRDVATRFRLRATAYRDAATRLKLGIRAYRDVSTRLKLNGRGYRDAATRLKLIGRTYANVASRVVLNVRSYRDVSTRLRLLRRGYRDVSLRFKLQLLQTPGWRDVQARFVLALPQLAPSLVFASLAVPTALISTVNLLAWASLSTPTAIDSEERPFLFASTSQPGALASTLDLLTWASSSAPTALASEAR